MTGLQPKEVKIIRATSKIVDRNILRVAAYCRVSTDSNEQELSLDTQRKHYESYIKANSEWEYAGIYYDDGISGTKTAKRDGLLRLVED